MVPIKIDAARFLSWTNGVAMMKRFAFIFCAVLLLAGGYQIVKCDRVETLTSAQARVVPAGRNPNPNIGHSKAVPSRLQILKNYGALPLAFEKNEGQANGRVRFLSRGAGYTLSLSPNEAILSLSEQRGKSLQSLTTKPPKQESQGQPTALSLQMRLMGADVNAPISGLNRLPGKSNYFIGSDPKNWHTNIANYAKVECSGVYSGVDLVYYGNHRQLEYDFVIAPHADPSAIRFAIRTSEKPTRINHTPPLRISADGDLIVKLNGGEIRFHKPVAYQENGVGSKRSVEAHYVLRRGQQVSFTIGSYDRQKPLVIDPVLSYSTYLGPSGGISSIAVDASDNAYVTGGNTRTGFPTTPGAFQTTCTGGCSSGGAAFVSKLNSAGSALVYSTYLAPSDGGGAFGEDIAVDSAGVAYVAGQTGSGNFPTTPGAFQTGCHARSGGNGNYQTGFVAKLDSTGSALVYSTYLGGSTRDIASGIALDASDNAYVTGITQSSDFPVTPGCFQPTYAANSETYDFDSFVTELNSTGSALVYSTFLGSGSTGGGHIVVDSAGDAYVVGGTQSPSFPTTPGAFATSCNNCGPGTDSSGHPLQSGFVSELNTSGSTLVYSTFLGGSDANFPEGIALDSGGNVYVAG